MVTPSPTQTLLTALQLGQLLKAARKHRNFTESVAADTATSHCAMRLSCAPSASLLTPAAWVVAHRR